MYFPLLRGRQFELIALREFAIQSQGSNNIIPIIEPVKRTFNSVKIALSKFIESKQRFAFIINPELGDFSKSKFVLDELLEELQPSLWIPTFIVKNNINDIKTTIKERNLSDVILICSETVDTSSVGFFDFVTSDPITYIISRENRTFRRKLKGSGKNLIRLDNCFHSQKRNADYLNLPEEKFTEEHLFYEEDGYSGFSDYTTIPDEYTEGGTTPYAISIHLTYQKKNEEIWIRHFTSESNDDQANIQGKFAEAAQKAVQFLDANNINTNAANELREYYNYKKYPGLGMIKKISIKNHIELVNSIL